MVNMNNTNEIQHVKGTLGFELPEDGMYDFEPGVPIQVIHDGPVEVTTLSGEHKTIGADEKLGTVTPMTRKALNSMNRALEQHSFNLFVDSDSNVTFSGGHLPSGTVMHGSKLELGKSASGQHVELDHQADINWQNGVIRETVLDHATNGKDDMSVGGGYLTKSVFKNGTELGMMDNHISQSQFDNVIVGHSKTKNVHFKNAVATPQDTGNKPALMNADLKNARIKTGPDSNFLGVMGHNNIIASKLPNNFDNVELDSANLTDANAPKDAKTGYTAADSKLSDVISTTPITASDANLVGTPWHPIVVNSELDVTKTDINTKQGLIVNDPDHKPLSFNSKNPDKAILIDDKIVNHGLKGFKVNMDNPAFTKIAHMDVGFYGDPNTHEVDAADVQKAADKAVSKPKYRAKFASVGGTNQSFTSPTTSGKGPIKQTLSNDDLEL